VSEVVEFMPLKKYFYPTVGQKPVTTALNLIDRFDYGGLDAQFFSG
jgi:hypothetical protein